MAYQFATETDVRRIARSVLATEGRRLNTAARRGRWQMPGVVTYIGKTDEAITARSSTTPGSGTVSLYRLDDSGDLEDTGENVTAYNLSDDAVASGAYVGLVQAAGVLWVNWEDC